MVLSREGSALKVRPVFLDPEGKMVVLDVTHRSQQFFRLITVYAPAGGGRLDFFQVFG